MQANEKASQYTYPFALMNVIFKYNPEAIPDTELKSFLPFKTFDPKEAKNDKNMIALFKYLESKKFYSKRGTAAKEFFSRIHWGLNNMIKLSLQNGAMPDLETMFREMLQQNFIKVGSFIKNDKFNTNVLWPHKELATGKITFYNKNEPAKISMKASIKIQ